MLNLDNIDLNRRFASAEEEAEYIRRYFYQFYVEANYRLDELNRRLSEIEEKQNEKG